MSDLSESYLREILGYLVGIKVQLYILIFICGVIAGSLFAR